MTPIGQESPFKLSSSTFKNVDHIRDYIEDEVDRTEFTGYLNYTGFNQHTFTRSEIDINILDIMTTLKNHYGTTSPQIRK